MPSLAKHVWRMLLSIEEEVTNLYLGIEESSLEQVCNGSIAMAKFRLDSGSPWPDPLYLSIGEADNIPFTEYFWN